MYQLICNKYQWIYINISGYLYISQQYGFKLGVHDLIDYAINRLSSANQFSIARGNVQLINCAIAYMM